jgi:hypothetical protein
MSFNLESCTGLMQFFSGSDSVCANLRKSALFEISIQRKESISVLIHKIGKTAVIIVGYHCYQLCIKCY